ncbi:hypothetical protein E3A20_24150 [Planctomyces bekefii]|uniref:Uncharacterized protein n=1 Tax=Planctomyces bekefii TaxID=1653850 RepID=A0A5C6M2F8_9PLAN|nr:hypothetical protein E3A20_24150 [Planctomyces bekefii]
MNRVSLFLLLAISAPSTYALANSEGHKSPYFIDGIHCEGIEGLIDEDKLKQGYPDDEVASIGIKSARQNYCETIFREYGVEKFQWATPEDIEKLSFGLRRGSKFQSVEIRLEKSELQNHVHLIGKFKPYAPAHHYAIDVATAVEADANSGSRTTTRGRATWDFNRRGEKNRAPYVFSLNYFKSTARDPLSPEDLSPENEIPVTMTPAEELSQARPDGFWGAAHLRLNLPNLSSQRLNPYMVVGVVESKLKGDQRSTSDTRIEFGEEFQFDPLIPTATRLSLLYSTYEASGAEIYGTEDDARRSKSKSIVFAGISQDIHNKFFTGSLDYYRSLTRELRYFGQFDFLFTVSETASIKHGLGIAENIVRGAILAEHRFGLPDRTEMQFYYRAEMPLSLLGPKGLVSAKVGAGSYDANNDLENPYRRENTFGELGLKTEVEGVDIGLAFLYGNRRLY